MALAAAATFAFSCNTTDEFPEPASAPQNVTRAGNTVVTFENAGRQYLAGPTSYGANLYDGYEPSQGYSRFVSYTDPATGLVFGINETGFGGTYNYWNGGFAVSRWNDKTAGDYTNQCSVYYGNSGSGNGGYGNSQTFAVGYGYNDTYSGFVGTPKLYFSTASTEKVIRGAYICNSTYGYITMRDGNSFSTKFGPDDWFKLAACGYKADGTKVAATAELYLADMREDEETGEALGITDTWRWFDLSVLGAVHKIEFDMLGSDTGAYGLNTPAYFCMDNLEVEM